MSMSLCRVLTKRTFNIKICIQFIFALLTGYLLYQELALFVSIPVHTTNFKKSFSFDQFPDFLICQTPGFEMNKLVQNGYRGSFAFLRFQGLF